MILGLGQKLSSLCRPFLKDPGNTATRTLRNAQGRLGRSRPWGPENPRDRLTRNRSTHLDTRGRDGAANQLQHVPVAAKGISTACSSSCSATSQLAPPERWHRNDIRRFGTGRPQSEILTAKLTAKAPHGYLNRLRPAASRVPQMCVGGGKATVLSITTSVCSDSRSVAPIGNRIGAKQILQHRGGIAKVGSIK